MIGSILRVRYELTQLVATGPIFATYLARDRVEGREVCVRVVHRTFTLESDLARSLGNVISRYATVRSPGVEQLYEVDEDQGTVFLVTEFTRGIALSDRIKKLAPFSVPVSISTLISISESLSSLHKLGLPHGDLRPDNVVILVDGQAKLQLAGVWESYSSSSHAGAVILPYMAPYLAPEISAGAMPSATGDVYAAGIILFELISGRLPFAADTPVSMGIKHATAAIPSVRMYNPSVPMVLDEIVKKSISKDPLLRYRDASDLLQDLRMMQDALRFGRSLNWPIHTTAVPPPAREEPTTTVQPITPRMSAVRPEPKSPEGREPWRERERGDVPAWIIMLIAFFGAVVVMLFVTWIYHFGSKAKEVRVPKVIGLKLVEAGNLLKDSGLRLKLVPPVIAGRAPADTVMEQTPGPGEKVREGALIVVHKSAGPATIAVPRIIGMNKDAAKSFVERSELRLDENFTKVNRPGAQEGEILEQSPDPYALVGKGTRIKITVQAEDADKQYTPAPGDENIEAKYNLRVKLAGLKDSVQLRVAIVDARGTRDVLTQRGRPEESFDVSAIGYGKEVTFQVFYDDLKVYEQKQAAPAASIPHPTPSPSADPNNPNPDNTSPDNPTP